ncbi:glutamine-hydrolyzing carbamoyl-phosphate synthase small subunit [Methylophaga sp. OBS3]|uniref:glutamine-hydrolyzing carbamoyl-phosphate synthase small subunit n=1 Tax=Methylophaga sp. OBS3 TaxID=2991934 RepID=UPI00225BCFD4|nr:glutamine-hydrolyzing carbamoyl-phosphate synthase small subunit [Methylophaga sp. OBS3]MCX4188731.1 glutamine-hydrolyzing carbamoyl-phosphate synthase small subunit [Methylophaga sp. OBS3]
MRTAALLALEDGTVFHGESIGAVGQSVGEVVFNTAMTGYQEILSDPSYCRQIVTLTYPHIGNVGVNTDDDESDAVYCSGLIIRELSPVVSSWRGEAALDKYLERNNVVGLAGIDTRKLTRLLREKGAQKGCIVAGDNIDVNAAIEAARNFAGLKGMDLAKEVTTKTPYEWTETTWQLDGQPRKAEERFHVVAYDYGIKKNIMRMLVERGCKLTVVPAQMPAEEVEKLNPDGIFLSNGPGDPEPCDYAIEAIKYFLEKEIPMFGICLGHQLLALASGAKTEKMKFGHHGANHPVQEMLAGLVMITSQNHSFAVDESSLPEDIEPTHRSLFDGTLQGIHHKTKPAFSFQGHPEASPGPQDAAPLFDHFIDLLEQATGK